MIKIIHPSEKMNYVVRIDECGNSPSTFYLVPEYRESIIEHINHPEYSISAKYHLFEIAECFDLITPEEDEEFQQKRSEFKENYLNQPKNRSLKIILEEQDRSELARKLIELLKEDGNDIRALLTLSRMLRTKVAIRLLEKKYKLSISLMYRYATLTNDYDLKIYTSRMGHIPAISELFYLDKHATPEIISNLEVEKFINRYYDSYDDQKIKSQFE